MKINRNFSTFLAECVGTFSLVLFGCSAIVVDELFGGSIGHVGISFSFGIIVMVMIYSFGNISGAHLNPAVTIGFFFSKRLKLKDIPIYISAQLIGAFLAALLLRIAFPQSSTLGATLPKVSGVFAFIVEIILTFILMLVILNVSIGHMEKGIMAGVAIGSLITLEAMVGGPLTGASMNPARSLGPAVIGLNLSDIYIYIFAPIIGAVSASPMCSLIQGDKCCGSIAERN